MSIVELMVTIIIVTILVTVILGIVSYGAYWLRRTRRPTQPETVETGPRFFYRYEPEQVPDAADTGRGASAERASASAGASA